MPANREKAVYLGSCREGGGGRRRASAYTGALLGLLREARFDSPCAVRKFPAVLSLEVAY